MNEYPKNVFRSLMGKLRVRFTYRTVLALAVMLLAVTAVTQVEAQMPKKTKTKKDETSAQSAALVFAGPAPVAAVVTTTTPVKTRALVATEYLQAVSSTPPTSSSALLQDASFYAGTPVGSVQVHMAPNSWGTVVLLPQFHQQPGSDTADMANDKAQRTQEESYKILERIADKGDVHMVMVEGELAGDVPATKLDQVRTLVSARNAFNTAFTTLKKAFAAHPEHAVQQQKITAAAQQLLDGADRQIALSGAPQWLAASGEPLTLVGSENTNTLQESREIVRTYIYAQDREAQLDSTRSTASLGGSFTPTVASAQLQQIMAQLQMQQLSTAMQTLIAQAPNADAATQLRTFGKAWDALLAARSTRAQGDVTTAASRNDNPFATVTDRAKLATIVATQEQKIQDTIITRRNAETAKNFADALRRHHVTAGVLQFGAGHEDGLTEDLNAAGLSVIVVRPEEVERAR